MKEIGLLLLKDFLNFLTCLDKDILILNFMNSRKRIYGRKVGYMPAI